MGLFRDIVTGAKAKAQRDEAIRRLAGTKSELRDLRGAFLAVNEQHAALIDRERMVRAGLGIVSLENPDDLILAAFTIKARLDYCEAVLVELNPEGVVMSVPLGPPPGDDPLPTMSTRPYAANESAVEVVCSECGVITVEPGTWNRKITTVKHEHLRLKHKVQTATVGTAVILKDEIEAWCTEHGTIGRYKNVGAGPHEMALAQAQAAGDEHMHAVHGDTPTTKEG